MDNAQNTWENKRVSRCLNPCLDVFSYSSGGGYSLRWWKFILVPPGSLWSLWQWWWWHAGWFGDYWGAKRMIKVVVLCIQWYQFKRDPKGWWWCFSIGQGAGLVDFDAILMWLVSLKPFKSLRCREHRSSSNPWCGTKMPSWASGRRKRCHWWQTMGESFWWFLIQRYGVWHYGISYIFAWRKFMTPDDSCSHIQALWGLHSCSTNYYRGARAFVATIARWTAIEERFVPWNTRGWWLVVGCAYWFDWKLPKNIMNRIMRQKGFHG